MHTRNPCSAMVRESRVSLPGRFKDFLNCTHPMAAAHTAPPAKSVTPVMKIAVSKRVIIQVLRMARLNRWIVSELACPRTVNEWLISFTSAWGRIQGGNTAARDRHDVVSASVLNAVVVSNIHWHWTPNGYVASLIGIGLAWLITLCVARLWNTRNGMGFALTITPLFSITMNPGAGLSDNPPTGMEGLDHEDQKAFEIKAKASDQVFRATSCRWIRGIAPPSTGGSSGCWPKCPRVQASYAATD
jgi:hypothetical protein